MIHVILKCQFAENSLTTDDDTAQSCKATPNESKRISVKGQSIPYRPLLLWCIR